MTAIWRTIGDKLGKFLVVRRDGSVPSWPHFVLGARDAAAPYALRSYAARAKALGWDDEYVQSILAEATAFEKVRAELGDGDPPAGPHRTDDPAVLEAMGGNPAVIHVHPDVKAKPEFER
jgi:hypothetical protein